MKFACFLLSAVLVSTTLHAQEGEVGAALREELRTVQAQLRETARRLADIQRDLGVRQGFAERPRLGVILGLDESQRIAIRAVSPQGPAARAGVMSGDVLVGIGDRPIESVGEPALDLARERLAMLAAGDPVNLRLQRGSEAIEIAVTPEPMPPLVGWPGLEGPFSLGLVPEEARIQLQRAIEQAQQTRGLHMEDLERHLRELHELGERLHCGEGEASCPPPPPLEGWMNAWRWQGLRLASLNPDLGRYFGSERGVLILAVEGAGLDALRAGDVLLSIDGEAVDNPRQAMRLLRRYEGGAEVPLALLRDRQRIEVRLAAPDAPGFPRIGRRAISQDFY